MKRARDFPAVHVCVSVTKERFSADIFPSIHRSARLDQKYICSNDSLNRARMLSRSTPKTHSHLITLAISIAAASLNLIS